MNDYIKRITSSYGAILWEQTWTATSDELQMSVKKYQQNPLRRCLPDLPKPDSPNPVSPKPISLNHGKVHSIQLFCEKNHTPYLQ